MTIAPRKFNLKINENMTTEHLSALNEFKSQVPDELQSTILKILADIIAEPWPMTCKMS